MSYWFSLGPGQVFSLKDELELKRGLRNSFFRHGTAGKIEIFQILELTLAFIHVQNTVLHQKKLSSKPCFSADEV